MVIANFEYISLYGPLGSKSALAKSTSFKKSIYPSRYWTAVYNRCPSIYTVDSTVNSAWYTRSADLAFYTFEFFPGNLKKWAKSRFFQMPEIYILGGWVSLNTMNVSFSFFFSFGDCNNGGMISGFIGGCANMFCRFINQIPNWHFDLVEPRPPSVPFLFCTSGICESHIQAGLACVTSRYSIHWTIILTWWWWLS